MSLPTKDIECQCGHVTTLATTKLRCVKCGEFLFYDDKEKKRHSTNQIYFVVMLVSAIGIVTYLFVEMIVRPLFG